MSKKTLFKGATLINEGSAFAGDLLVVGDRIERIANDINADDQTSVVDCEGQYLVPGMIDDQVHFREPGLTKKGDLTSESRASVAGGTTSFMDMPNVNPSTITREALADKYALAEGRCHANYAFYFGATNDNIEEIRRLKPEEACGIKAFMGASTGSLLVDDGEALRLLFRDAPILVVTHCEDSPMIWANERRARETYGDDVPIAEHPRIRSAEACLKSSTLATGLAREFDARLHVLHLTTADEMVLFDAGDRNQKRVTAEVCIHHLWFDESDYESLGTRIKCNPAIKTRADRDALREALRIGKLDVIATDHAPHLIEEKAGQYFAAPAGLPLTQHALLCALELAKEADFDLPFIIDKVSHAPADLYGISDRGYLREGYFADLVLLDPNDTTLSNDASAIAKCGWTPFVDQTFGHRIAATYVNGGLAFDGTNVLDTRLGQRLATNSAR